MPVNANNEIVITPAEFRAAFPEFSNTTTYTDAMVQSCLDQAACYVSIQNSGRISLSKRTLLIELMAAHILCLRSQISVSGGTSASSSATVSGKVIHANIGDVSVDVQAPNNATDLSYWMNQTPYGSQFLALVRALICPMLMAGSRQRLFNNEK